MYCETVLRQDGRVFRCRPIVSADLQRLCNLMAEVGASFAGLASRSMHFAIGSDAVTDNGVTMGVADLDGELVGFTAAVVDPAVYWKGFLWRHPLIGANAVVHKLLRGGRRKGIDHWNQSSPTIARILYVGVVEPFRGKGVAEQLYRTVFHILADSGVQQVEAHIDRSNLPSIRLHTRFGGQLRMINENTQLLWTLDLSFVRGGKGTR